MPASELLPICIAAFIWVFTILIVLAVVMRLIILIFPEKKAGTDAAVIAALSATVQAAFPGTTINKIEEGK